MHDCICMCAKQTTESGAWKKISKLDEIDVKSKQQHIFSDKGSLRPLKIYLSDLKYLYYTYTFRALMLFGSIFFCVLLLIQNSVPSYSCEGIYFTRIMLFVSNFCCNASYGFFIFVCLCLHMTLGKVSVCLFVSSHLCASVYIYGGYGTSHFPLEFIITWPRILLC